MIEDICTEIRKDWMDMLREHEELRQTISKREGTIGELLMEIDRLKVKHAGQLTKLEEKHAGEVDRLDHQIQGLRNTIQKQDMTIQETEKKLRNTKQQLSVKEKELIEYRRTTDRKQREMQSTINRLTSQIADMTKSFQAAKQKVREEMEKHFTQKMEEMQKMFQEVMAVKETELAATIQSYESKLMIYKQMVIKADADYNSLEFQRNTIKKQLEGREKTIQEFRERVTKYEKIITQLEDQKTELQKTIDIRVGEYQLLQQQHHSLGVQKQQLERRMLESNDSSAKVIRDLETVLEEESVSSRKKIQKYEEELAEQIFNNQETIRRYEDNYLQKTVYAELQIQHERLQAKLNTTQEALDKRIREVQALLAQVETLSEQHKHDKMVRKKHYEKQLQDAEELRKETVQLMQRQMTAKLEDAKAQLEEAVAACKTIHSQQIEKIEMSHREQILAREKHFAETVQKWEQTAKAYEDRLASQKHKYQSEMEDRLRQHQEEIRRKQKEFDEAKQLHKLQLQKERKELNRKISEQKLMYMNMLREGEEKMRLMEVKHSEEQQRLQRMVRQFKIDLDVVMGDNNKELLETYKVKVEQLETEQSRLKLQLLTEAKMYEEKIKTSCDKLREELDDKCRAQIQAFESAWTAKYQLHQRQHEQEKAKIDQQYRKQTEVLGQQLKSVQAQQENVVNEKNQEIKQLKESVQTLGRRIGYLQIAQQNAIKQIQSKDAALQESSEILKRERENRAKYIIQEKVKLERLLKKKMDEQINKSTEEAAAFANNMKKQFEKLQQIHAQEIQALRQEIEQLIVKLSERPSRMEDISTIKDLIEEKENMKKSILEAKYSVQTANDMVKYLQLELDNYKEIYNIFGGGKEEHQPEPTQQSVSMVHPRQDLEIGYSRRRLKSVTDEGTPFDRMQVRKGSMVRKLKTVEDQNFCGTLPLKLEGDTALPAIKKRFNTLERQRKVSEERESRLDSPLDDLIFIPPPNQKTRPLRNPVAGRLVRSTLRRN